MFESQKRKRENLIDSFFGSAREGRKEKLLFVEDIYLRSKSKAPPVKMS